MPEVIASATRAPGILRRDTTRHAFCRRGFDKSTTFASLRAEVSASSYASDRVLEHTDSV